MDAARWQKIEEVLDVALETDRSLWPGLLDERCSGDPELRREVEALLARLDGPEHLLDSPPAALAAALVAEAHEMTEDRNVGRRIGAYVLVRQIGRGGMARVYLAERADGQFAQTAAIKLLRPGLDSELDVARFRRERQILARLEHPNIARLLDGGVTEDGVPYLVMEHVEGQPIDVFCRERGLTVGERIRIFLTVLDATQYAHRNLVVHRDLKPSNILVTRDAVVKLLDFGLARLLESETGPATRLTRTESRWMTPEYAAPEQIRGDTSTTLTDVYQLGVVFFELLTDALPFGRRGGGLHALENAILNEDPPLASALSKRPNLTGDLDAITARALSRESERRYASATEFAEELRRHLSGHPVRARRQTMVYRARRFVRRHVGGVATTALVAALAIGYVATVIRERDRVQRALEEARLGTHRAEQVTDFMLGLFQAAEGGRGLTDTLTARTLLTRALGQARELAGQPAMQAQMLDVIGRLHTQLGNPDQALPLLEEAFAIRRGIHGPVHPDVVTTLENIAAATGQKRDVAETVRLRREALELRRLVSGDDDPRTTTALHELASALHVAGDADAARPLFQDWVARVERQPPERTSLGANQLSAAANLLWLQGEAERAEPLFREALAIRHELYGDEHHMVAESLIEFGVPLATMGRPDEAEPLLMRAVEILRAVYPDGHPQLAEALRSQGMLYIGTRRFLEAQPPLREALEIRRRTQGDGGTDVAILNLELSYASMMSGQYIAAESLAREAVEILRARLGDSNAMVFHARTHLGDALRGQGRLVEAEEILLGSFERFETPRPVTRPWRDNVLGALVRLYTVQGRTDEADRYQTMLGRPAYPPVPSIDPPNPPR